MCGIAGTICLNNTKLKDTYVLEKMMRKISDRGPDGHNIKVIEEERIGLVHTRLAIIDLSENANQPMCDNDGTVYIVFNGEIYNHQEIRQELNAQKKIIWKTDHSDTEVIIAGKVFTLSGYESEEYLQKVASYINNKVAEYSKVDSFKRQSLDTQNVLMQLNIADDYFKAKNQITRLEEEIQNKEKEMYDLKHELIASQIKLENMEKNIRNLQTEANETAKKIVRLETELKEKEKKK